MAENAHTPGPWEYVPSTEHHGPYVCSPFGNTIADLYVMTHPGEASTRNGGPSRPVHHLGEYADANARLIAMAPEMLGTLQVVLEQYSYDWPEWLRQLVDTTVAKAEGRA